MTKEQRVDALVWLSKNHPDASGVNKVKSKDRKSCSYLFHWKSMNSMVNEDLLRIALFHDSGECLFFYHENSPGHMRHDRYVYPIPEKVLDQIDSEIRSQLYYMGFYDD